MVRIAEIDRAILAELRKTAVCLMSNWQKLIGAVSAQCAHTCDGWKKWALFVATQSVKVVGLTH